MSVVPGLEAFNGSVSLAWDQTVAGRSSRRPSNWQTSTRPPLCRTWPVIRPVLSYCSTSVLDRNGDRLYDLCSLGQAWHKGGGAGWMSWRLGIRRR